jgi:dTDP-4-amino-4,6-dideoxygalactose transaminase
LENLDIIQKRRKEIWQQYYDGLKPLADKGYFEMPDMPDYATNNAHMFYLVFPCLDERTKFIARMKELGVGAVFHYLSLHQSDYYRTERNDVPNLPNSDKFADCLVRFPMYYELTNNEVSYIINSIKEYFE